MTKVKNIFAEVLEQEALNQFESAMDEPYAVSGALMPDVHAGYALPIGAVVATEGVIVPSWVGYDIGCGMCALKLDGISKDSVSNNRQAIFDAMYREVPVGFNLNRDGTPYSTDGLTTVGIDIAKYKNYERALGSLGGGNHFIEVGYDTDDAVWIVIHSGSRGVGHGIATHYMKTAHPQGKCVDGHFGMFTDSPEGENYIQDLKWCLDYALANRKEMMRKAAGVVASVTESDYIIDYTDLINRNHNHAEERDGLWIHRKGATHAEDGMLGVIPGNMRDGSFIVRGKGNPDSLYSSSHGAGRVIGRKQAKRVLSVEDFQSTMGDVMAKVEDSTLDESPFAYKNIWDVMELQKDLVDVIGYVKPLINIKG